jgi:hypothetical protein
MIEIGKARATSTAAPSAIFARWADVATWPEWNTDTEWVRLNGPFATGTTGVLKPKGGPATKFVIDSLTDREFVDVSKLLGARLTFHHAVSRAPEGKTHVDVRVWLDGPLAGLWYRVLGKGIKASLQSDLDRLMEVA